MTKGTRSFKSRNIPVHAHATTPEFAEPKRTRRLVPEELKFFGHPPDFVAFYTDLLPNLEAFARSRLKSDELVSDAVADFSIYMLGNDRHGTPRWRLYNNDAFKRQPYFKWLITQFGFFCLDVYNKNIALVNRSRQTLAITNAEDGDEHTPGTITLDRLFGPVQSDPTTAIMMDQITNYIAKLSKPKTVANKRSFEANLPQLYQLILEGSTAAEISDELLVSTITVREWKAKLCELLKQLIPTPISI